MHNAATQHGGDSGSAGRANAASSSTITPIVARPEPGTDDDDMDTDEPCTTPKRAKTAPTQGGPDPNPSVDHDEPVSDDDDVAQR